jgi:tetratricopeptide (TPR) repeat protein
LHGLLKSAEALGSETKQNVGPSMDDQIQELAAELNQASALQVMAGLKAIADRSGRPMPAAGFALLAKAQMLLGKTADGLKSFEAALAAEPDSIDFQINTGAARLAEGDVDGALMLLRGVYNAGLETLELKIVSALLKNLSVAEARANQFDEALKLRLQWFQTAPESVSIDRWLKWAKEGFAKSTKGSPAHNCAFELLKSLQVKYPQERSLTQALADAFEDQGDFREAALLYRELLKP